MYVSLKRTIAKAFGSCDDRICLPEGHSEGYQRCVFERPHRGDADPSHIYLDAVAQPASTTIHKSVVPCELPQLLSVKHHSRFSSTSICWSPLPSLRVTLWCTTRLWQVAQLLDCPQALLSITLIWNTCHFEEVARMCTNIDTSVPNSSCYSSYAVLTLNALHRWSLRVALVTETSLVDLKGDLHLGFCFAVDHLPL